MTDDARPGLAAVNARLKADLQAVRRALKAGDRKWVEQKLDETTRYVQAAGLGDDVYTTLEPTVRAEKEALQADLDLLIELERHRVGKRLQDFIASVDQDEYPERWAAIRAQVRTVLSDPVTAAEKYMGGDEAHLMAYVRAIVALETARGTDLREKLNLTDAEVDRLEAAVKTFYEAYIRPKDSTWTNYQTWGELDTKKRVLHGAAHADDLDGLAYEQWLTDVDAFLSAAARHEYSQADAREVVAALKAARGLTGVKIAAVESEMARLAKLIALYGSGPAQLVALEEQWRAYRYNKQIQDLGRLTHVWDHKMAALQDETVTALKHATAYCWAPTPVEAVASAALTLQPEMTMSSTALGDLANPGACGWWWFQDPIPIQTLAKSGQEEPVVALLWRREYPTNFKPRIWFSLFVAHNTFDDGTMPRFATPSTSWVWEDGVSLAQLPAVARAHYAQIEEYGRQGLFHRHRSEATGVDVTVAATVWFSEFFLMAATWLRQRLAATGKAQGVRQVSRRLQREHKLLTAPTVEIIELRRREILHRAPTDGPSKIVDWQWRWIVHGFTRNQFYPSTGEHAPKYIESYWKGPDDKPIKEAARVYAVKR